MSEVIKCPTCRMEVRMENNAGMSFCPYCGSNLAAQITKTTILDKVDISSEIQSLLNKGWDCEQKKEYKMAEQYYNIALKLDNNIPSARTALQRIMPHVMDYNLTIVVRTTSPEPGLQADIRLNGYCYNVQCGGSIRFKMPIGAHNIGIARYYRGILISDSNTRVTITYTIGSVNHIDIAYGR